MTKFFDGIYEAIRRHVNFKVVKCCLLASPAFLKARAFELNLHLTTVVERRTISCNT